MRFLPTCFPDAWLLEPSRFEDERGHFFRTFCDEELKSVGLSFRVSQCSVSFNHKAGTLRGMHFQRAPFEETKLVRCTHGRICDVIVDIRPDSETFSQWQSYELSAENGRTLLIPKGFAHGFQTLEDQSEVHYMMDEPFQAGAAGGFHFDDPSIGINWPLPISVVSQKDLDNPSFDHAVRNRGDRSVVVGGQS